MLPLSALPQAAQSNCRKDTVGSYLKSNIVLLRSMIAEGYGDPRTLERRVRNMESGSTTPSFWKQIKTPNTLQ